MAGATHGAWCHIEIPSANVEAARAFYGGLFGWTFEEHPEMKYTIYKAGEGEVGGGLWDPPPGAPRRITNYVNVADLDASAKRVVELGGRVIADRMEVPGHGWFRMIADPDGNVLALWQSAPPAPAPKKAKRPAKAKARRR